MTRHAQVKAVTFDAGGTLIEPWPSVGHVYAEVAARHGFKNLSPEMLNGRFTAAWQARSEFDHTREEWAGIVEQTFAGLISQEVVRSFFPELYECFAEPSAWRIYDDVLPTLAALTERRLKLGVVSNWDDRLRPLLHRLNLDGCFRSIVVSCEVGSSKPARRIFHTAMKQLGVPASAILHVGDSFEMDVQGARAAGFHAVQILRKTGPAGEGQIRSLLDLAEIVCPTDGK